MKAINYLIITLFLITFSYCSKDNPTAPGDGGGLGGGIGGGGNGNVTITISIAQDNQGQQHFLFKPSNDVVVIQIRILCAAQQIDETVQGDGQTTFTSADGFSVGPIDQSLLQSGQQWTFNINGKMESSTGTAYDVTANFNVP